jgi:hypothetical protein
MGGGQLAAKARREAWVRLLTVGRDDAGEPPSISKLMRQVV